jgi:DNA replication protein DnaC
LGDYDGRLYQKLILILAAVFRIITSQLPIQSWHQAIGDSTLGDAILDRLVHNAYRISPEGESMRKKQKGAL